MRLAGETGERRAAERFVRALAAEGIEATCREETPTRFGIWVMEDAQLATAQARFEEFLANPTDPRFDAKPALPKRDARSRARIFRRDEIFGSVGTLEGPLTLALTGICIFIAAARMVPNREGSFHWLMYSEQSDFWAFTEIAKGEVWRLVTPALLHGDALHLVFNMLWLLQFGGVIERTEGTFYLAALFLVSAALSNTAQYMVSGPHFVGMSGVVYALFGYIWGMSRYSNTVRYGVPPQTSRVMFIWLLLCIFIIPGVANTAHVVGLLVGIAWAFLRSGKWGNDRRRRKFRESAGWE